MHKNLGLFAIKLSMEKRIKKVLAAWFSDLPAINATVFSVKIEATSPHINAPHFAKRSL